MTTSSEHADPSALAEPAGLDLQTDEAKATVHEDRSRPGLIGGAWGSLALQGQTVERPTAVNSARTRAIWLSSGGVTSAQG